MGFDEKFDFKKLTPAAIIMVVFWAIAVVLWQTTMVIVEMHEENNDERG